MTGGTTKSVTREMNNTSCGKCRRKKKSNETKENNITMGTCLGLQSNWPTKILLVPCESQPSSSTRYWILDKRRAKIPFFGSNRCHIVQHMGNRVSEPFQGHVFSRDGQTVIKGILTDGASEGRYFELVLFGSPELKGKVKACGNSTELCGFLRRSSDERSRNYEETHDAFLHTAATENFYTGATNLQCK